MTDDAPFVRDVIQRLAEHGFPPDALTASEQIVVTHEYARAVESAARLVSSLRGGDDL